MTIYSHSICVLTSPLQLSRRGQDDTERNKRIPSATTPLTTSCFESTAMILASSHQIILRRSRSKSDKLPHSCTPPPTPAPLLNDPSVLISCANTGATTSSVEEARNSRADVPKSKLCLETANSVVRVISTKIELQSQVACSRSWRLQSTKLTVRQKDGHRQIGGCVFSIQIL